MSPRDPDRPAAEAPIRPVDAPALSLSAFVVALGAALLLVLAGLPAQAAGVGQPYRVLLLHSFRSALPINAAFTSGTARGLAADPKLTVEIDSESLDLSRFNDAGYQRMLIEIFRLKYADHPPDIVVPTYTPALRFMLEHGDEAFPGIPVVFCGADVEFVQGRTLPERFTGVTVKRDFAGTLGLMRHVDPQLRQVAVVVGAGAMDRQWEADARAALQGQTGGLEFDWLRGLPPAELAEAVRGLPAHSAVLYVVQFVDRNGAAHVPKAVAAALSSASPVPVYGTWDTLLGSGILGGRMEIIEDDAVVAGGLARRVLGGERPAALPVVMQGHNVPIVDARQLQRWGIDEARLPPDSQVLFRTPTTWEQHREAIVIAVSVIVLQAAGIVALLVHRSRLRRTEAALRREAEQRLQAESQSAGLRARLSSFSKQSALGALATGIAHEVNQPLAAIKNYVQAARRYLTGTEAPQPKVRELLVELEAEAGRAADIVQRIRGVISRGELRPVPTPLRPLVRSVLHELDAELAGHGCRVVEHIDDTLPPVLADPIQLQVLLVNLLRNAIESLDALPPGARPPIALSAAPAADGEVEVRVIDQGPGIAPEAAEEVFEPLFSTKTDGMGVGLATCRSIVQAHGGRIWHTPNLPRGAIFHVTLLTAAKENPT